MNRREVVREIQKLVKTIVDDPSLIDDDWMKRMATAQEAMAQLSPSDLKWADEAYQKWAKNNPKLQEAIEALNKIT